jgi:hypothetical protein
LPIYLMDATCLIQDKPPTSVDIPIIYHVTDV